VSGSLPDLGTHDFGQSKPHLACTGLRKVVTKALELGSFMKEHGGGSSGQLWHAAIVRSLCVQLSCAIGSAVQAWHCASQELGPQPARSFEPLRWP